MDEEDVVYIYNEILLSHKKEQNFAIYSYMDGLRGHYAKYVRQRKTNIILYHLYVESKKVIQMNLFTKQK